MTETQRIRVSTREKAELGALVAIEGGDITELLVEGLWRVVAHRKALRDQPSDRVIRPRQPLDQAIAFRPTTAEVAAAAAITSREETTFSAVMGEGIWRVINDRQQDMRYRAEAERITVLLAQLEMTRATLHQQT